ncbi:MAG TPA: type II secretion system F family protein [Blastocatellia bacterium]|nr:type II secretion system F family protein [Blastocatellia bacterium]
MYRWFKYTLYALIPLATLIVFILLSDTQRLALLIALAVISLAVALYFFITRDTDLYRQRVEMRLQELLAERGLTASQREMRLLKEELLSDIPLLHRLLLRFEIFNRLKELLRQADLKIVVNIFLIISLTVSFLVGWLVFVTTRSAVITFLVMPPASLIPLMYVLRHRRKRFETFVGQLPDALELMIRSLQAGHSFTSALQTVATEMPDPVAREFGKAYEEQNLGLSIKIALENLVERMPIPDLKLCVTAILIQREVGGNLAEVMHNISHTIRERFRIQGEIRVKSAQARLSGYIVSALPFILFLLINMTNPGYMQPLYDHEWGTYILTGGIAMQIIGWLTIKRITRIEL